MSGVPPLSTITLTQSVTEEPDLRFKAFGALLNNCPSGRDSARLLPPEIAMPADRPSINTEGKSSIGRPCKERFFEQNGETPLRGKHRYVPERRMVPRRLRRSLKNQGEEIRQESPVYNRVQILFTMPSGSMVHKDCPTRNGNQELKSWKPQTHKFLILDIWCMCKQNLT